MLLGPILLWPWILGNLRRGRTFHPLGVACEWPGKRELITPRKRKTFHSYKGAI
jgi:hypothetical protein